MAPLPDSRGNAIARLEHHERQTAFGQVRRCRQANGACSDYRNRHCFSPSRNIESNVQKNSGHLLRRRAGIDTAFINQK